jgi:ankyrin repeat protein
MCLMNADWRKAVATGDVERVRALLESGADVNALDGYGQTALMLASHKGHVQVVRKLVAYGANLDHTAKFGLSALMLAVIADHPKVVRVLMEAGADATIRGSGRTAPVYDKTALQLADSMGRLNCAEILRAANR